MALTAAPLLRVLLPALRTPASPLTAARALATSTDPQLPDYVAVLPMPQLSPHMKDGVLKRLLKKEGDHVRRYDLIAEVETDTLTEEAYKVGDFEGTVSLLIEAQDEGYLARSLAAEGQRLPVGAPLALVCDEEAQVAEVQGMECGVTNVYDLEQPPTRVLTWQSYLTESKTGQSGCT